MRTVLRIAAVTLLATSLAAATADPPYVGKWKANNAKSDFGQLTATYEAAPGGGFKATMDGVSYTFKTDGKPVATPWGTMQAVKAVDATTWASTTTTADGKPFSSDTMKLSADGKSLTVESKMAGGATSSMTFSRVSGGPGLAGTWKAAKANTNAGILEISSKAADAVTMKMVDMGATCDGKLDGKPNPATGAAFPSGWTCTFTKSGNGFTVGFSKDGKAMYSSTYTVSADGKTLTEAAGAVNTKERTKVVYDRQ